MSLAWNETAEEGLSELEALKWPARPRKSVFHCAAELDLDTLKQWGSLKNPLFGLNQWHQEEFLTPSRIDDRSIKGFTPIELAIVNTLMNDIKGVGLACVLILARQSGEETNKAAIEFAQSFLGPEWPQKVKYKKQFDPQTVTRLVKVIETKSLINPT